MIVGSDLKVSWKGRSWVLAWIQSEEWEGNISLRMAMFFQKRWGISLWKMFKQEEKLQHEARQILFISPAAIKRMITRVQVFILQNFEDEFKGLVTIHGRF